MGGVRAKLRRGSAVASERHPVTFYRLPPNPKDSQLPRGRLSDSVRIDCRQNPDKSLGRSIGIEDDLDAGEYSCRIQRLPSPRRLVMRHGPEHGGLGTVLARADESVTGLRRGGHAQRVR